MLSEYVKNTYGLAAVTAASNTDSNTSILDMQGYDGIMAVVTITDSVATGVATLNIQQSLTNADSGMATITGATATATCTVNDDLNGTNLIVDVYKPLSRYVQANVVSATANIAFSVVQLFQYKASKQPVTQGTSAAHTKVVGVAQS